MFQKIFRHLKVNQSFLCFRVNQVYMLFKSVNICVGSPRWIFISSPVVFVVSPIENLFLGLTPENY